MDPVADQLEAYNSRDLKRFLACYSPEVVVEDAKGAVLMKGRDELRRQYGALFEQSPELHCELVHRIRVGEYVIDEERVRGLGNRPSDRVVHAVAIYRVVEGRIVHVRFLK